MVHCLPAAVARCWRRMMGRPPPSQSARQARCCTRWILRTLHGLPCATPSSTLGTLATSRNGLTRVPMAFSNQPPHASVSGPSYHVSHLMPVYLALVTKSSTSCQCISPQLPNQPPHASVSRLADNGSVCSRLRTGRHKPRVQSWGRRTNNNQNINPQKRSHQLATNNNKKNPKKEPKKRTQK